MPYCSCLLNSFTLMSESSFFTKLLERKVPQYLGTYLAVGFGLLQFIEFISKRFGLSGAWVDAYLIAWLVLVPAVSLLLYYKGLPPSRKGNGWKRWLIYVNVVLAVLLAMLLPGSEEESPTTVTVMTTDESGVASQRVIPAESVVQRIGVFEMLNAGDEKDRNWWGAGYALLLHDDLRQRPEVLVKGVRTLNTYYKIFEVPMFSRINLATQRKIAERANTDFFVRAEYKISEDSHEIFGGLYRTRDGKKVQTLETVADNGFTAIDNLKEQIEGFLPPPVVVDQAVTNLPVSALITDNEKALEYYTKGLMAFVENKGDLPPSVAFLRQSVATDPSCAPCLYELADKLYGQGKPDSALTLLTKATKLAEVLPEREQIGFKATLLNVSGQYDNYFRLMESARTLYPYEFWPYSALEGYYEQTYGVDSAIVLMNTAAQLSDRETALRRLYSLYVKAKDYDRAEEVIKDLDKEYASPEETKKRYATFYEATGEIDKARNALKDLMATDPTNLELPTQLAKLEVSTGYYDSAEKIVLDVLKRATSRPDSASAWNYLIRAYAESGRVRKALSELEAYERFIKEDTPVNVILGQNFMTKVDYASKLKNPNPIINTYTEELSAYGGSYFEVYKCYALVLQVLEGHQVPDAAALLSNCKPLIASTGKAGEQYLELAVLRLEGKYEEAADLIDQQLSNGIESAKMITYITLQRMAGRLDRAAELAEEQLLKQPNDPNLLLEKAQVMVAKGDNSLAKKILSQVLQTWRDADADHVKLSEARELALSIGLSPVG